MKSSAISKFVSLLIITGFTLALAACFKWQEDTIVRGVAFEKVRLDRSGLAVGVIKSDTLIKERLCQKGWVHLHTNGVPARFATAAPIELAGFTIPVKTWVMQNAAGIITICAFPEDTLVQGHLCRGSGGPGGVQAAFYPSGKLKQFFLRHNTRIQGVPCEGGLLNQSVMLHESGALKSCKLSEAFTQNGVTYEKGKRIQLDPAGRVIP